MKNKWLFIAGLSGFLCVTIGAFAAHGLSKVLEPKELAWIEISNVPHHCDFSDWHFAIMP